MFAKAMNVLAFDWIIEQLATHAATVMGKERCSAIAPSADEMEVRERIAQTDEAVNVCRLYGGAPFGGIRDLRQTVALSRIGSVIEASALLDVAQTVQGARRLRSFLIDAAEKHSFPRLLEAAAPVADLPRLEQAIIRCLDEEGRVKDSASPALAGIRQSIRTGEARLREKLEQMLRNSNIQKMLQDPILTIRSDRYVLPVKQEYRNAFGGIVHDQSASGATLYMEPESAVPLNNKLRELVFEERREIERILRDLSRMVADDADALTANLEAVQTIDEWFARAGLAQAMKATRPKLNGQGNIRLKRARHPQIPADKVVPVDVELHTACPTMIITGPNTGGKTVTLKCVGLISLMAMSGLFIPAAEESMCSVFDGIFVDIGDEQSIEQSLSTFSSHMTQIVAMLPQITSKSLVLLDEVGAGTDPAEGAALARAILEAIHQRGGRTMATTHYRELKSYAYDRQGMQNASMEFDVQSLRPTYRLIVGVPGRSNAFAIAERLGLPKAILDDAATLVEANDREVEQLLTSLEQERSAMEKDRDEAERTRRSVEQLQIQLAKEQAKFVREKERWQLTMRKEAEEIVRKAKAEAEAIVTALKERQAELERQARSGGAFSGALKPHEWNALRKRLDDALPDVDDTNLNLPPGALPPGTGSGGGYSHIGGPGKVAAWKAGDWAVLQRLGQKAQLLESAGNGAWWVQCGAMRLKATEKELLPAVSAPDGSSAKSASASAKVAANTSSVTMSFSRAKESVRNELDLRGARVDEAFEMIDRYLDEAVLAGYGVVHLIHGKGTGALRQAIQPLLSKHPHVRSFRMGNYNEGGSGCTVVELK